MSRPKPCRVEGCELPKVLPKQRCVWHALMAEPIDYQVAAARAREATVPEDARLARLHRTGWAPGTRWCASCQSLPPLFYFAPGASQCRACSSATRHAASIKREYDLTVEEYNALLLLQDGKCAICRQRPVSQRLAVDHDHQTGAVRGLCCSRCNHDLLGAGWDNGSRLRDAATYLDNPPMSGRWTPPNPRKPARGPRADPASTDPTYLMHDHEATAQPLPTVLEQVVKRMTVDQLILSGGRSDPDTGTYWLAYRRAGDEQPPWETHERPTGGTDEAFVTEPGAAERPVTSAYQRTAGTD